MIQYPCKPSCDRALGLATDTCSRLGSVEMAFLQGLLDGEQPGAEGVRGAHIPYPPRCPLWGIERRLYASLNAGTRRGSLLVVTDRPFGPVSVQGSRDPPR